MRPTEEFQNTLTSVEDDLENSATFSAHRSSDRGESLARHVEVLREAGCDDLLVRYVALAERLDASADQILTATITLNWVFLPTEEQSGVPEWFTPVTFDQLRTLVRFMPRTILYAWRQDCDPCDVVQSDFEELFADTTPEETGLFAIYGPNYAEQLRETYDIFGAPIVTFFEGAQIEARLRGAHPKEVLEAEIEQICPAFK